jgi:hypothetical protein
MSILSMTRERRHLQGYGFQIYETMIAINYNKLGTFFLQADMYCKTF